MTNTTKPRPCRAAAMNTAKNKQSQARCYLMDVYPTLCEKTAIPVPATVQSKSFAACLLKPETPHRKGMYFSFRQFHRAYSDGKYKLIEYNVSNARHTQLFDIVADPLEIKTSRTIRLWPQSLKTCARLVSERPPGDENGAFWKGF